MPSFSEKEAKTKASALSFGHIVPSADIIKSNPPLFYKNRGVPPPPNSELKISGRNFVTPCGLSLRSGRLTAIKRENPANFPQIRLRRTSLNRDVMCNVRLSMSD